MSKEPVKSVEVDCPVSPYSQHQIHLQQHHPHHHNLLTCHRPHTNHLSHPRLEVSNKIRHREDDVDHLVEEEEKIRSLAQNKLNNCNELIRCRSSHLRHQSIESDEPNIDDINNGFLTSSCSELSGGQVSVSDTSDRYELANSTIASSTSTSPTSLQSSSPPSSTSSSDSTSSIEDCDDEYGDENDARGIKETDDRNRIVDDNEDEEEEDDDDDDDVEDEEELSSDEEEGESEDNVDDSDDECEDIVDPVGNHHGQCNSIFISPTNDYKGVTKATNPIIDNVEDTITDDEEEDDDDVSFDESEDFNDASDHQTSKHSMIDSSATSDLLDSERMLEVTRKLVRSTERDPDRDLRKQVLLKTAIRKLPHFMEYNPYPDSFDQSFQFHSNDMSCGTSENISVNLSSAQYYEHHHHLHMNHVDSQPKSYYHSVQPNSIQMSTTSLRMLDLNDDQESETNPIIESDRPQHHHHHHHQHIQTYGNGNEIENNVQTSLEQQQQHTHDYASHSQTTLNMYHYSHQSAESHHQHSPHINTSDSEIHPDHGNDCISQDSDDNQNPVDQVLTVSTYTNESGTDMIANHDTIENLYQPMSRGDMTGSDVPGVTDETTPITFPLTCTYTSVSDVIQETDDSNAIGQSEQNDCFDDNKTFNNLDEPNNTHDQTDVSSTSALGDEIDQSISHQMIQYTDCHQDNLACANTYFSDVSQSGNSSDAIGSGESGPTISKNDIVGEKSLLENNFRSNQSQILSAAGNSDGNSNSSNSSDDCFLTISRQNDSSDGLSNASLLETSLNSVNDYHHRSYDSGVALFSPRSNKRSSSSIGLDDEMEIDHLNDLSSMSQQNPNSGSNVNHCKRLRKREVMD